MFTLNIILQTVELLYVSKYNHAYQIFVITFQFG